ncbi:hypothetical protein V6N13_077965 [Hibiscus sabdariffa]|uniref:Uncharacterized protein n=1 Tax=Hibiscus sabdariffa TaxID=183260 RepID=A0ABR2RM51_9ROSI
MENGVIAGKILTASKIDNQANRTIMCDDREVVSVYESIPVEPRGKGRKSLRIGSLSFRGEQSDELNPGITELLADSYSFKDFEIFDISKILLVEGKEADDPVCSVEGLVMQGFDPNFNCSLSGWKADDLGIGHPQSK